MVELVSVIEIQQHSCVSYPVFFTHDFSLMHTKAEFYFKFVCVVKGYSNTGVCVTGVIFVYKQKSI